MTDIALQAAVDRCVETFEQWNLLATTFATFACAEANSIALIFAAAGHEDFAHQIIESHTYGDLDPDDAHHDRYLGQTLAHR